MVLDFSALYVPANYPKEYFDWDVEMKCNWHLKRLELEYREKAKPYIDLLIHEQSMKPPPPIFISFDQISKYDQERIMGQIIKDTDLLEIRGDDKANERS